MNKKIDDILSKPGRKWTKEEAALIETLMKKGGRAAFKERRKALFNKADHIRNPAQERREPKKPL